MERDFSNLADTYLRQHETKSDEDFWACEEVNEIVRSGDLELAWQITLLLLRKAPDNTLGYVAAGPLEDLIDGYGDQALDLVEQSCDGDMRLQFALSGVWLLPDSPVLGRFRALMAKYGFGLTEDKRKPLSPHPDCW
jgi:hypothetical protein